MDPKGYRRVASTEAGRGITPRQRLVGFLWTSFGLLLIASLTLYPTPGTRTSPIWCLYCDPKASVDAILNVGLFLPLGFGLARLGLGWKRALALAFATTLTVELLQLNFIEGRDASLRDLATNTLGGALGFAIGRWWRSIYFPTSRHAVVLGMVWSSTWLASEALLWAAARPDFPPTSYFGQRKARLRQFDVFRGSLVDAKLNGLEMPVGRGEAVQQIETVWASEHRLIVDATVTAMDAPTSRMAPVVSVFDEDRREILVLGQWGTSLVLRVHGVASRLRLLPFAYEASNVFPGRSASVAAPGDTLRIHAELVPYRTTLRASAQGGSVEHEVRIRPGFTWMLASPREAAIDGMVMLGSLVWLVIWSFPLGYWAFVARRDGVRGHAVLAFSWTAAVIVVVLWLLPWVVGGGEATAIQATCTIAAAFLGILTASRVTRTRAIGP